MIIKVCGLNKMDNLLAISGLEIEMIGLNFYEKSKRYIGDLPSNEKETIKSTTISKVGVFVNEDIDYIRKNKYAYGLDYIQLHGDESPAFCKQVQAFTKVIKVFGVDTDYNFKDTRTYDFCDLFLFDTKDKTYGGTGRKFQWDKLSEYKLAVPFLLAGGIGPNDIQTLGSLNHPQWIGIDINSKFETQPGIKDLDLVKTFCSDFKNRQR